MRNSKQEIQHLEKAIRRSRKKLHDNSSKLHAKLQSPFVLSTLIASGAVAGLGLIFIGFKNRAQLIGQAKKLTAHKHQIVPMLTLLRPLLTKFIL